MGLGIGKAGWFLSAAVMFSIFLNGIRSIVLFENTGVEPKVLLVVFFEGMVWLSVNLVELTTVKAEVLSAANAPLLVTLVDVVFLATLKVLPDPLPGLFVAFLDGVLAVRGWLNTRLLINDWIVENDESKFFEGERAPTIVYINSTAFLDIGADLLGVEEVEYMGIIGEDTDDATTVYEGSLPWP